MVLILGVVTPMKTDKQIENICEEHVPNSLAVNCKSEENCAFDDKSTIFGTEIIEILRNIF